MWEMMLKTSLQFKTGLDFVANNFFCFVVCVCIYMHVWLSFNWLKFAELEFLKVG